MKDFNTLKNRILWVVFYLFSTLAFANDDDPGFPMNNDPGQEPVPIDDYIIPAIILMILFVFYTIRKYQKKAQEL